MNRKRLLFRLYIIGGDKGEEDENENTGVIVFTQRSIEKGEEALENGAVYNRSIFQGFLHSFFFMMQAVVPEFPLQLSCALT